LPRGLRPPLVTTATPPSSRPPSFLWRRTEDVFDASSPEFGASRGDAEEAAFVADNGKLIGMALRRLRQDDPPPPEAAPVEGEWIEAASVDEATGPTEEAEVLDAGTTELPEGEEEWAATAHGQPVLNLESAPVNPDPYGDMMVASEDTDFQSVASQPNPEDPDSLDGYVAIPAGVQPSPEAAGLNLEAGEDAATVPSDFTEAPEPAPATPAAEAPKPDASAEASAAAASASAKVADALAAAFAANDKAAASKPVVDPSKLAAGNKPATAPKGLLGWQAIVGIAVGGVVLLSLATAGLIYAKSSRAKAGAKAAAAAAPAKRPSAAGDVESRGSRGGAKGRR
jgi:hypothetical protein